MYRVEYDKKVISQFVIVKTETNKQTDISQ